MDQPLPPVLEETKSKLDAITNKIFVFYMLVACNFLAVVFSCDVQRFISQNMYVIHVVAIMTLYFSVILVDSSIDNKVSNPVKAIGYTIALYFVFLLSTHCHFKMFFLAILVMFSVFVAQTVKNYIDDVNKTKNHRVLEVTANIISYAQVAFQFLIAGLIVFGFLVYTGEQSIKFNHLGKWNWMTFWFDTPCNLKRTGKRGQILLETHGFSGLAFNGLKKVLNMV
jgi:hypothetical protein